MHLCTTDQDLKTLKTMLLKPIFQINDISQSFTHYHSFNVKDMYPVHLPAQKHMVKDDILYTNYLAGEWEIPALVLT